MNNDSDYDFIRDWLAQDLGAIQFIPTPHE
jgi:hypothetical protein